MSHRLHRRGFHWQAGEQINLKTAAIWHLMRLQEHQAQAVFNQTEDYVMFPDEATTSLCVWDSRNASRKQLLSLGHNGPVLEMPSCHVTYSMPLHHNFTIILRLKWKAFFNLATFRSGALDGPLTHPCRLPLLQRRLQSQILVQEALIYTLKFWKTCSR